MELHAHATVSPDICLHVSANSRLELLHDAFADIRRATLVAAAVARRFRR